MAAAAAALPDSTWVGLPSLPDQPRSALFALAVDPSNNQVVIAGDLAVEATHEPVRFAAGSDAQPSSGGLPLYQSLDGGLTWNTFPPPISGTITVRLAAGPLPPTGNVRPLLAGTNSGLFNSKD